MQDLVKKLKDAGDDWMCDRGIHKKKWGPDHAKKFVKRFIGIRKINS